MLTYNEAPTYTVLQCIIVVGNPVDGLSFVGPFEGHDGAVEYAENMVNEYDDLTWIIADLNPLV